MTKTIIVIRYDDETDTSHYRVVQGEKHGDGGEDLRASDKAAGRSLARRLGDALKKRPMPVNKPQ